MRTKILCTIGPASASPAVLQALLRAGMDAARLNLSHGTHANHAMLIRRVRAAAKKTGKHVPIIADLQGPKIRLGELPASGIELRTGSIVQFVSKPQPLSPSVPQLPVTYTNLYRDVQKGHRILIDDGLIEVRVTKIAGTRIEAQVINGGTVTSHKGMNFPDSTLRVAAFTPKDQEDAAFAVQQGAEWIALSFVTNAKEVLALKTFIKKERSSVPQLRSSSAPRVIVKIEKHEALRRFDEILAVADAVMVARGDLGVETPAEDVPLRQKELIEKCRLAGKPVVVATQMLDSMIRNPRPTRAEVSDVANAVCDHADAVMLSGETASGKYPVQAARMMAKIVADTEASRFDDVPLLSDPPTSSVQAVSQALRALARAQKVQGIISSTELAPWSEQLLMAHAELPLFLAAPNESTARQVSLRWGVESFVLKNATRPTFVRRALTLLKKQRRLKKGTCLAVVLGGTHGEGFDLVEV